MAIKKCANCTTLTKRTRCWKCWSYYRSHKPNASWQNKDWLEKQYKLGKSFATIGKESGVGATTIEYWFKKFNLTPRPAPYTGLTKGSLNPSWKGGRIKVYGYIMISAPDTPRGYAYEHRLMAEKMLGRPLTKQEVVHHKNGIRDDNRPENLEIFPSHASHKTVESNISTFARQLLYGNLAPHLKNELQLLLAQFLSKNG